MLGHISILPLLPLKVKMMWAFFNNLSVHVYSTVSDEINWILHGKLLNRVRQWNLFIYVVLSQHECKDT